MKAPDRIIDILETGGKKAVRLIPIFERTDLEWSSHARTLECMLFDDFCGHHSCNIYSLKNRLTGVEAVSILTSHLLRC